MITVSRDITERKQVEQSLQESEEKWRSMVNASPDFIALHDPEGRYLFLNHYAEGFTEKDVIGTNLFQYILPELAGLFRSNMEKAILTWTAQHFEMTALGDQNSTRTYEEYLVPLHGKDQQVNILAVARDITERKQAEEEIPQPVRFPEENPEPVLRISADGILLYANEAADAKSSIAI